MYATRFFLTSILLSLCISFLASGVNATDFDGSFNLRIDQIDNSAGGSALDGFITNDLLVDTEGQLVGYQLFVYLEEGSIYQDIYGSDTPPVQNLVESFAPSLAYDSFLANGSSYANGEYNIVGPYGGAVDIISDEEGDLTPSGYAASSVFDTQLINTAWSTQGGQMVKNVSDHLLSRLTFSDDAVGYWKFLGSHNGYHTTLGVETDEYNGADSLPHEFGKIEGGVMSFRQEDLRRKGSGLSKPRRVTGSNRQSYIDTFSMSISQVDNSAGGAALDDFVTNDVQVDYEGKLLSVQMYLELEQGEIYQDPKGADLPPHPMMADLGFSSVPYDTYVAFGRDDNGVLTSPGLAGGAMDIGGTPTIEFDEDILSITWYGTPGTPFIDVEDFLISRISLSEDALGDWAINVGTDSGILSSEGTIANGLLELLAPTPPVEPEPEPPIPPAETPVVENIKYQTIDINQPDFISEIDISNQ